ncbi:MAG TPA: cytochrome c oxidase assembly protein [Chthoniobacterales bacterium]
MEVSNAVLESWTIRPEPTFLLAVAGVIYWRGWLSLRRLTPARFGGWQLVSFLGGLLTAFVAISSPIDAFGNLLLSVHMVQHLLLMMIAPALIQLGAPYLPLLSGLPRWFTRDIAGPVLQTGAAKRLGGFFTHPVVCWLAYVGATLGWHVPFFYELTLHSSRWHELEHACFLGAGLLFWFPIIQPWPSRSKWPRWASIPYLLLADVQNTALAAFLSFYDQVLYPSYGQVPRLGSLGAVADQNLAGSIMWVPGSLVFLLPAGVIAFQFLTPKRPVGQTSAPSRGLAPRFTATHPAGRSRAMDLLRLPYLGPALRSLAFRRSVQTCMLCLAALIIVDGLRGPQTGATNLAGVLPWVHWRGLTVLALLVMGNFFCYACPFTWVRDLGRRWLPANRSWPKALRSKWLAATLVGLYLWAYEAFSLWNSPCVTAWIVVGYFGGALLVDGFFRGASFCKYVCPIGQFHFFQSWFSPFEVKVRTPEVCRSCVTHDCIRGNADQRGCELSLFQPRKQSNQDCTFCLDCVRACPHDNVGVLAVKPAAGLGFDLPTSSVGRLSNRTDLLALTVLLTFGAYAAAAGMVVPVAVWIKRTQLQLGFLPYPVACAFFYLLILIVVPALLSALCGWLSRRVSPVSLPPPWRHFIPGLAPLGAGLWIAHFTFHLFAGSHTPVPILQRLLMDLHWLPASLPLWAPRSWAFPELLDGEILVMDVALLLSLLALWRTARRLVPGGKALRVGLPWIMLAVLMYLAGVWIVFQPMQMRGIMAP